MENAKTVLECKTCGNKFIMYSKKQYNNEEDMKKWEQWAEQNITECKECYRHRKQQEDIQDALKYNLPKITAKSTKQLELAETLRAQKIKKDGNVDTFFTKEVEARKIIDYILGGKKQ